MALSYQESILLQGFAPSGDSSSQSWIVTRGLGVDVHLWVADTNAVISASDAHAGAFGMQITASADDVGAYQNITLTSGKWYCLSVWVKVTASDSAAFGVKVTGGATIGQQTSITDTTYTRYSLLFEATTTSITIFLHAEDNGDIVFFDDITIDMVPDIDSYLQFYNKNYLFMPTRSELGLFVDQNTNVKYEEVYGNENACSFVARIYPRFAANDTSGVDRYVFRHYSSDNVNDYFGVYYDVSDSDWVFYWKPSAGNSITLRTQDAQRFLSDTFIELSGWIDTDGRVINGTTYYGKFFVNGIEVNSTQTVPASIQNNLDELYIGSLGGTTNFAECIIEEIALFAIALEDKELIAIFDNEEPLLNVNATWSVNYTLASNDILTYDAATGSSELYDVSITDTIPIGHLIPSGARTPSLRGGENEEATLYFPVAIAGEIRVIYRPHWP